MVEYLDLVDLGGRMCKFPINLMNLQEDEIVNYLYSKRNFNYSDNSFIQKLITRAFISKDDDFKLHVIHFLKSDPDKCIRSLYSWNKENNKLRYTVQPRIRIDNFCIEGCKNFLELCLTKFRLEDLNLILSYLSTDDYDFSLCCLRSSVIILHENSNNLIKEQFDEYLDFIIDFCINCMNDQLVKLEVIKLLGHVDSPKCVSVLEYLKDNDSDFTVRIASMMGLDSISRLSMRKSNKDNSDIKKIVLNYRR